MDDSRGKGTTEPNDAENGTGPLGVNDLTGILFGHAAFQYLHAGCEFGLLESLAGLGGLTFADIQTLLGLESRPTKCLLLGLTALRLLRKIDDRYLNSQLIEGMIVSGTWELVHRTAIFEARIVYPGLEDFVESLRTDKNIGLRRIQGAGSDLYRRLSHTPSLQRHFYNYMSSWSKAAIPLVLDNFNFSSCSNVFDVGCGDGTNAVHIALAHPHLKMTLLDLEDTARIARATVAQHGLDRRLEILSGDIFKTSFPRGFDCFLFIHQLVIWSLDAGTELLRRAYEALPTGGRVLIFSSISSDDGAGPLMAALDSSYFMTVPHEGGLIHSWSDYKRCLLAAGFFRADFIPCRAWTPHGLIIGTK